MHNELGITKDDIRQWVKDAVNDVAKSMVAKEFGEFSVDNVVQKWVVHNRFYGNDVLKKEVQDKIGEVLSERIEINLKTE
jgi:hypothetical protein